LPRNLISDEVGFSFLAKVSIQTFNLKNGYVFFNFLGNEWFDANLCSSLGVLLDDLKTRKNDIKIYGVNENVERVFKQNGFYYHVVPEHNSYGYQISIIDYKKFHLNDVNSFQEYVSEHLLKHDNFPVLSTLLSNKIAKSILEIFNNAHIHGKTQYVYTCGQYIQRLGLLKFTISDMGRTIRKNVNDYLGSGSKIDGVESIVWAVEEGNTTKTGNIPGGLGISLIRDFLTLNEGKIQIISSDGFWEEKIGLNFAKKMDYRFLGTIVNLEFNLNDKKTYILASEINPQDIF
jgi:hypothetical protein